MDRLLGTLAIVAAAAVVGIIIGVIGLQIRQRLNTRNQPEPYRRAEYLTVLRAMKAQGRGFHQRMAYLREQGLRADVAEGMIVDADANQPPDLERTKKVERGGCTLECPGNWRVSALDQALDAEKHFVVEGPDSGVAIFSILEPEALPFMLTEEMMGGLTSRFDEVTWSSVTGWGEVQGQGFDYTGFIQKQPWSGTVIHVQGGRGVLQLSVGALDEDRDHVTLAFGLIQRTLQFNG